MSVRQSSFGGRCSSFWLNFENIDRQLKLTQVTNRQNRRTENWHRRKWINWPNGYHIWREGQMIWRAICRWCSIKLFHLWSVSYSGMSEPSAYVGTLQYQGNDLLRIRRTKGFSGTTQDCLWFSVFQFRLLSQWVRPLRAIASFSVSSQSGPHSLPPS